MKFSPNKQFALEHLDTFIEKHISDYNRLRNFDFGIERRDNISLLSPYISHRVLLEFEIIKQILKKYSFSKVKNLFKKFFGESIGKDGLNLGHKYGLILQKV